MKTAPTPTAGKYLYVYRVVKAENVMMNGLAVGFRADSNSKAERKSIQKAKIFGTSAKLIAVKRI